MHKLTSSIGLSFVLGVLSGCAGEASPSIESETPSFAEAKSGVARDTSPNASAEEMAAVSRSNAAFTMRLYGKLAKQPNVFFSPVSITSALAMTYAGARGSTAKEMETALSFELPAERTHVALNALDLAYGSRAADAPTIPGSKPFSLRTANTAFAQKELRFEQGYLDTISRNYGAGVKLSDFRSQYEVERGRINQWVEGQTEKKIKDLLPAGSVDGLTRLVLVNAVYFNADWAFPFVKEATAPLPFTSIDGKRADVETMRLTAPLAYTANDTLQAIELPYQGHKTSMVVVLPRGDLGAFETAFDGKALLDTMAGLTRLTDVRLSLPKFELESGTKLRAPLSALGMTTPFEADADFSGMAADPLHIDDVLHKTFVRVDEKGTEAAAATAAVMAGTPSVAPEPVVVTVDKPFLVFIRDIPTNTVLFAGRIGDPK